MQYSTARRPSLRIFTTRPSCCETTVPILSSASQTQNYQPPQPPAPPHHTTPHLQITRFSAVHRLIAGFVYYIVPRHSAILFSVRYWTRRYNIYQDTWVPPLRSSQALLLLDNSGLEVEGLKARHIVQVSKSGTPPSHHHPLSISASPARLKFGCCFVGRSSGVRSSKFSQGTFTAPLPAGRDRHLHQSHYCTLRALVEYSSPSLPLPLFTPSPFSRQQLQLQFASDIHP